MFLIKKYNFFFIVMLLSHPIVCHECNIMDCDDENNILLKVLMSKLQIKDQLDFRSENSTLIKMNCRTFGEEASRFRGYVQKKNSALNVN